MNPTHLIIHGRVQGVFFRDWTVRTARQAGRDRMGAQPARRHGGGASRGAADAVEDMIAKMHDGPPAAPRGSDRAERGRGAGLRRVREALNLRRLPRAGHPVWKRYRLAARWQDRSANSSYRDHLWAWAHSLPCAPSGSASPELSARSTLRPKRPC